MAHGGPGQRHEDQREAPRDQEDRPGVHLCSPDDEGGGPHGEVDEAGGHRCPAQFLRGVQPEPGVKPVQGVRRHEQGQPRPQPPVQVRREHPARQQPALHRQPPRESHRQHVGRRQQQGGQPRPRRGHHHRQLEPPDAPVLPHPPHPTARSEPLEQTLSPPIFHHGSWNLLQERGPSSGTWYADQDFGHGPAGKSSRLQDPEDAPPTRRRPTGVACGAGSRTLPAPGRSSRDREEAPGHFSRPPRRFDRLPGTVSRKRRLGQGRVVGTG
ncbi:hypothetical protein HRbin32_01969 [bacterium HR32]|nr:hypothetical protein HRbin32_01969 [bacterium HR32]